jgi:hypothetical protein
MRRSRTRDAWERAAKSSSTLRNLDTYEEPTLTNQGWGTLKYLSSCSLGSCLLGMRLVHPVTGCFQEELGFKKQG